MTYDETYRPQFHFTAERNWLNDPNGLIFFEGEYHLFFQHNPEGLAWGSMTWGHAVSTDLVRWTQLEHALYPDSLGTMFSGSAVADWDNTSGFASGGDPPLVLVYTAAGGTSDVSEGQPFTQCMAYSSDRGRSWTKWQGNPVLGCIAPGNRDPKIGWHEPSRYWIMALYLEGSDFALLRSPDLKQWSELQRLTLPGCDECPDFFELELRGEEGSRWIFVAANGKYLVGEFDGERFEPETGILQNEFGPNFYATQTFSDLPGRRVQIAWMRGGEYPGMPFNQQMSFPCELTLRTTADGPRLFRWPVDELSTLLDVDKRTGTLEFCPGEPQMIATWNGVGLDLEAEIAPWRASALEIRLPGSVIRWDGAAHTVSLGGCVAPLAPDSDGLLRLRLLVDRTSVELYLADGAASIAACCLVPPDPPHAVTLMAEGGQARIVSAHSRALRSAWR